MPLPLLLAAAKTVLVKNLTESFIDNVIRDTVDEPALGSIVYCELLFGTAEHSGIYIGNNKIVHLDGDGFIEAVSPKKLLNRLDGFNTARSIYVSCSDTEAIGSKKISKRAKSMIVQTIDYSLLNNNCHQFTVGCITGDFDNSCRFLWELKSQAEETLEADTWRIWDI